MNESPNNVNPQTAANPNADPVVETLQQERAQAQAVQDEKEVKANVPTEEMYQAPTDASAIQFETVVAAEPKKEEPKPAFVVIDPRVRPEGPATESTIIEKKIENALLTTNSEAHSREEIENYKKDAILCYIPFVSIYHLITRKAKAGQYMFFHVNQGFILTLFYCFTFALNYLLKVLFKVENVYVTYLPGSVRAIRALLLIICLALSTFGMVNSYNGKSRELPFIGRMRILR